MDKKKEILRRLSHLQSVSSKKYRKTIARYPNGDHFYTKNELLEYYKRLVYKKKMKRDEKLETFLKTKPTRTISGVAPVTVLTKPYPCPGGCVFCPTSIDQPKSYLSSEPGAMRAKMFSFNPFMQTRVRIKALENIGHSVEKIELIILGGTWSFYPKKYQLWFVLKCFEAMNTETLKKQSTEINIEKTTLGELKMKLIKAQISNETAKHRCVGLVIETRPDFINKKTVQWLRFLGVTKVQLGMQSLNSKILTLNKRGHTVKETKRAISVLRLAGFKIHAHWMCNLYGSNLKKDKKDFIQLFKDVAVRPDELKIYPCILLKNTYLYSIYKKGDFHPYSRENLLELLVYCKQYVPKYCRITRLFRDIPSFEIEAGVIHTNFRQIVQLEMEKKGLKCNCIRCREIRFNVYQKQKIKKDIIAYKTSVSCEYFISYITHQDKLLGFLRLSIPKRIFRDKHFIKELQHSSIIREVHVYGKSISIKNKTMRLNTVQHAGIGTKLLKIAEDITIRKNITNIAVISAIGTREYYRKRGYVLKDLYMLKNLK